MQGKYTKKSNHITITNISGDEEGHPISLHINSFLKILGLWFKALPISSIQIS